jgi:hypothetical protein
MATRHRTHLGISGGGDLDSASIKDLLVKDDDGGMPTGGGGGVRSPRPISTTRS